MNATSKEMGIFTEALRLSTAERADYLDHACEGDEVLRRKIEALLEVHERVGDFLEQQPTEGRNGTNNRPIQE